MDHVTTAAAVVAATFVSVTLAVAAATLWAARSAHVEERSAG